MSLAQGNNTPTRPRIEPGSPDPESDAQEIKVQTDEFATSVCSTTTSQNTISHARESQERITETRTDVPTEWISLIVVAPKKNGEIRLCVDLQHAKGTSYYTNT